MKLFSKLKSFVRSFRRVQETPEPEIAPEAVPASTEVISYKTPRSLDLVDAAGIKREEGIRLVAYKPHAKDVWTIGYGHTHTAKPGMKITLEDAEALFLKDTRWAVNAVRTMVKVPLTQNMFDALVSFVFNVGAGNFKTSTLLRTLNAGDYFAAANQFPRWKYSRGALLKGLVNRRKNERALFLKGSEYA